MSSFKLQDVGLSDTTDRDKFMNYIDTECNTFKGKLSQAFQSSMIETDYYSIRVTSGSLWYFGVVDDSQKKQYTNKFVCTLSIQDVIDYFGTSSISGARLTKYISTFFLSDESCDIVGRDNWAEQLKTTRVSTITHRIYKNDEVRLCPVFTIDLTKLSSAITLNGNILNG